ncbi:hypothetical protein A2160_00520 [Candidatus Beckwithbacteria bacterium RBG_13_42_9]|uniref:Uncharacterized protein n=1 Tax=Candidatus Beckwithbacteria bacterium RBG_13_42_9 TaxID=1797457 RepID=A0A1F5E3S4_9BACT|nr:MAG: hypothetical protein A2160_00520 [Candidatus Beckwithbacteria bacterium RBG_13_42_9]
MNQQIHKKPSFNPELTGEYEFIATNETLGVDMVVHAPVLFQGQGAVRLDNEAEVQFTTAGVNRSLVAQYNITQEGIPDLNFQDTDMIEEIFGRYGFRFSSLESVEDAAQLPSLVFVDIEEQKERHHL